MNLLSTRLAQRLRLTEARVIKGGDIAHCFRVHAGPSRSYQFLKVVPQSEIERLDAEANGLLELSKYLADNRFVQVPQVHDLVACDDWAGLLTDWVEQENPADSSDDNLGRGLAELHCNSAGRYGGVDNYLGNTPQCNEPVASDSWPDFFIARRLNPQRSLAIRKGLWDAGWETRWSTLVNRVCEILPGDTRPSPLHGDLWNGNVLRGPGSRWSLIDPAFYCGDPLTDVAMMRLFGGFGHRVYEAYHAASPTGIRDMMKDEALVTVYNLYHLLNHLNLFGAGYRNDVERSIRRLT